jgi:glutaredoxin
MSRLLNALRFVFGDAAPSRASVAYIALATLMGCALPAYAQQYKVIGANGKVTYTDRPPVVAGDRVSALKSPGPSSVNSAVASLPLELRQAAQRYPVTLYVTGNCAPCDSARQFLQQRGIPHTEKTVSTVEDGEALQRVTGGRDAPAVTIGAQVVRGLSTESWASYLDAAGYPKTSKLPANYQFASATPLTERRDATPKEKSARPPPLLNNAEELRPNTPPTPGSSGFKF